MRISKQIAPENVKKTFILTHLAYKAHGKKHDISNNNSQFRKPEQNVSGRHLLVQNDVIYGIRRCNVVFMLERRYTYM